jgi:hypothetical protein
MQRLKTQADKFIRYSFTRSQVEPGNAILEALPPLPNQRQSLPKRAFPGSTWEREEREYNS